MRAGRTSFRIEIAIAAGALVACAPAPKAAAPASPIAPTKIEAPESSPLAAACTPTGPELCFNAIDDNCNGVIDEGCGVGTGVLQFTIAWNEPAADVDIAVTDPSMNVVKSDKRTSPTGLRLDRDCGRTEDEDHCGGQNTENVYFEGLEPPRGRYQVDVRLVDPHGARTPIAVRFGARVGAHTYTTELSLRPGDDADEHRVFAFTL